MNVITEHENLIMKKEDILTKIFIGMAQTGRVDMLNLLAMVNPLHKIDGLENQKMFWDGLMNTSLVGSKEDAEGIKEEMNICFDNSVKMAGSPWQVFSEVETDANDVDGGIKKLAPPYVLVLNDIFWKRPYDEMTAYQLRHQLINRVMFCEMAGEAVEKLRKSTGYSVERLAIENNRIDLLDKMYAQSAFDVNCKVKPMGASGGEWDEEFGVRLCASSKTAETTKWLKEQGCDFSLKWKSRTKMAESDFYETLRDRFNILLAQSRGISEFDLKNKVTSSRFKKICKAAGIFNEDATRLYCVYKFYEKGEINEVRDINPVDWIKPYRDLSFESSSHILKILIHMIVKDRDQNSASVKKYSEQERKLGEMIQYMGDILNRSVIEDGVKIGLELMQELAFKSKLNVYSYYEKIKRQMPNFLEDLHTDLVLKHLIDFDGRLGRNMSTLGYELYALLLKDLLWNDKAAVSHKDRVKSLDKILKEDAPDFFKLVFMSEYLSSQDPNSMVASMTKSQADKLLKLILKHPEQITGLKLDRDLSERNHAFGVLLKSAQWPKGISTESFFNAMRNQHSETEIKKFEKFLLGATHVVGISKTKAMAL